MATARRDSKAEGAVARSTAGYPASYGAPAGGAFGPQTLIAGIAVVTALYFGRDVFVPVALAVLLTFLLSPLVSFLRRLYVPRTLAVIAVVAMAMLVIFSFAVVVANQLSSLAGNLPSYQYNIQSKIRDFKESGFASGTFDRAASMLEELEAEIADAREEDAASTAEADEEPEPIPVFVEERTAAPLQVLRSMAATLLEPLATAGLVIVFVIFMLLRREDMRDRFIRLVGSNDLHRTTNAIQDAGRRVGRYLLMQLVVNVTYAVPIAAGLWLIGVPNALLWGLLALVLRFVPYVGPIIAAFFPLTLAIAVDPGWSMLLWTAALIISLELVSNNLIEPWLYGSRTGLSPVAIILAAIFWTWLWGPIGLLLSTPLTVCFVVLGRHVPQFEFLDILLGNEPVLAPHERLYQRLLAGDPYEATEQAERFLAETPRIGRFYDEVAIPALVMVEQDRTRGVLDEMQREIVARGALELVENLAEHEDEIIEAGDGDEKQLKTIVEGSADYPRFAPGNVLCAGARGNLDDASAAMVSDVLEHCGIASTVVPHGTIEPAQLRNFDFADAGTFIVSYLNRESIAHARFLVRRLRRLKPSMNIVIAFWAFEGSETERAKLEETLGCDRFTNSVAGLEEWIGEVYGAASGSVAADDASMEERPTANLRPEPAAAL